MPSDLRIITRYDILGPPNGCDGPCEGTGWVPLQRGETDPILARLWQQAEEREHSDDGWHFVACPKCTPPDLLVDA